MLNDFNDFIVEHLDVEDMTGTGAPPPNFSFQPAIASVPWDPLSCKDWDQEQVSTQCIMRIKRDLCSIYNEPPPGIFVVPDPENITLLHALITGPFDTPYEGGFFYFIIRCPPNYPMRAPRVKFMTTGEGQVRFNPNLYKNGKVCLSILGTWMGPAWSPAHNLSSLLISIQSLLNDKPYHNEPGFETERQPGDIQRYNDIIRHETLRVAVCDVLEGKFKYPAKFRPVIERSFPDFFPYYESTCQANIDRRQNPMPDPFGEQRGALDYASLLRRLQTLHVSLASKVKDTADDETNSDTDEDDDKDAAE